MQFLIQTTIIPQVKTNIAIIRSRVNQNRNNLITKLIIHLNDRFLMVFLFVIQHCINTRNSLTNILNSLCLLRTIYLRLTTLILLTISSMMISPQAQQCTGSLFYSFVLIPCPLSDALNFLGGATFSLLPESSGLTRFLSHFPLFFALPF